MKIAYISCFSAPEPSLSEYSLRFAEVIEKIDGIELVKLDLSAWQMMSGKKMYAEVERAFKEFSEQEGVFDCYHFELLNHHLMVWAALLAKAKLSIAGKVFITMHDPPLPVNGSLGLFWSQGKLSHYLARLADVLFPQFAFRNLDKLVDGVIFLTKAGETSFLSKWPSHNIKTAVIPHVPFNIPDRLLQEWANEKTPEKSEADRIEVFFAGLWWKHKGIEELIQAVSLLADEGKKVRLVMSGTGPASYVKIINSLLAKLSIKGIEVEMPGHLELEDLYQRGHHADCWVVPYQKTNKVSSSGILFRAISAGAKIVISDLPQFVELKANGSNIHFYKMGNFESLKNVILNCYRETSDCEIPHRLHEGNITFNELKIISRIESFYKEPLSKQ